MESPVKKYAIAHGLQVIEAETFRDISQVARLADMKPDIIVVAAYGLILPESVLAIPRQGCINIHPSLLPKYRGPSPIAAAILNGDLCTGVSIMLMEIKVDSGPILCQRKQAISDDDTAESLSGKLADLGATLLIPTIHDWRAGNILPRAQDESQASYTRMETKEDGRLDWNLPAVQLWRRVRAYYPWPGCYTHWRGKRLKVIKALPLADTGGGEPGEVIMLPDAGTAKIAVRTGEGMLALVAVQPEGKKEMGAADFLSGHREFVGSVL